MDRASTASPACPRAALQAGRVLWRVLWLLSPGRVPGALWSVDVCRAVVTLLDVLLDTWARDAGVWSLALFVAGSSMLLFLFIFYI